jgi:hypothetical protein
MPPLAPQFSIDQAGIASNIEKREPLFTNTSAAIERKVLKKSEKSTKWGGGIGILAHFLLRKGRFYGRKHLSILLFWFYRVIEHIK